MVKNKFTKVKMLSGIAAGLVILFIYSCENKSVPISVPQPTTVSSCDTDNLTYSSGPNKMKPIIDAQCSTNNVSCHATGGTYDYTTYAGIYANYQNGSLYSALFLGTPNTMPLTAQPGWSDSSACMLAKFKAWIHAGAPQ